jgi:hypothetical protein
MSAPPPPVYIVGIRDLENPLIIREERAISAAVLDSGVLRATIEPGTETYFTPGMWVYMQRR